MRRGAVVALLMVLGACAIQQPPADFAEDRLPPIPAQYTAAPGISVEATPDQWSTVFNDAQLTALITEALRANPDLVAAAARRDEAVARIQSAASLLRPQVFGFVDAARFDTGILPADDQVQLGVDVNWEIDLWGRLRSLRSAARQEAIATALQFRFAQQSIAALVADAWFLSIAARQQIEIAEDRLTAEQATEKVTAAKVDVGAGTALEHELAVANVALARQALERARAALEESVRGLEVLLGRYPANEVELAAALPVLGADVPIGVPSSLLERRPDVVAADRIVAAAFHRVEAAKAARLPRVSLTGSAGTLIDPSHAIWSIGSNLLAPLYTGGAIEADIDITTAQQRQALANYVAVGLDAFREVETTLANERYLQQQEAQLQIAGDRMNRADRIAQDRYQAGLLSIIDLNQVRQQYFNTRSQLVDVRTQRLRERINLYRALGGDIGLEDEAGEPRLNTAREDAGISDANGR